MDPRLEPRLNLTRRRFLGGAGIGIGTAALGELLHRICLPRSATRRCHRRTSRAPALRAEGQARHLSVPGRRAFAARPVRLQAAAREAAGQPTCRIRSATGSG